MSTKVEDPARVPRSNTAFENQSGGKEEMLMLELVLEGLAGILVFALLYLVGRVVLRGGGGDDTKDVGLD